MAEDMDSIVAELKKIFPTKDELDKFRQSPDAVPVKDILEHMSSCTDDKCGLHQFKNDVEKKAWMTGFILGNEFGKS